MDTLHLLNLACLKHTGQQLPSNGSSTDWKYVIVDGVRRGVHQGTSKPMVSQDAENLDQKICRVNLMAELKIAQEPKIADPVAQEIFDWIIVVFSDVQFRYSHELRNYLEDVVAKRSYYPDLAKSKSGLKEEAKILKINYFDYIFDRCLTIARGGETHIIELLWGRFIKLQDGVRSDWKSRSIVDVILPFYSCSARVGTIDRVLLVHRLNLPCYPRPDLVLIKNNLKSSKSTRHISKTFFPLKTKISTIEDNIMDHRTAKTRHWDGRSVSDSFRSSLHRDGIHPKKNIKDINNLFDVLMMAIGHKGRVNFHNNNVVWSDELWRPFRANWDWKGKKAHQYVKSTQLSMDDFIRILNPNKKLERKRIEEKIAINFCFCL